MKKNILVIIDEPGWAFDKVYQGLAKNSVKYNILPFYLRGTNHTDLSKIDLVLNLPDNYLAHIPHIQKATNAPILQAIRSNVNLDIYENRQVLEVYFTGLICSNQDLFERFENSHKNVFLAPGGVDTDFYEYKSKKLDETKPLVVGWAGSIGVFNAQFRGLNIIDSACCKLGWIFNPALAQERKRNADEMKRYYQDEIDFYVEMSESVGRQNGLVEAMSCGVPSVSYSCGIAKQLFDGHINLLETRDVNKLVDKLFTIKENYEEESNKMRNLIIEDWSWKVHAKKFEDSFDSILEK